VGVPEYQAVLCKQVVVGKVGVETRSCVSVTYYQRWARADMTDQAEGRRNRVEPAARTRPTTTRSVSSENTSFREVIKSPPTALCRRTGNLHSSFYRLHPAGPVGRRLDWWDARGVTIVFGPDT
jgi:hypothetical protein